MTTDQKRELYDQIFPMLCGAEYTLSDQKKSAIGPLDDCLYYKDIPIGLVSIEESILKVDIAVSGKKEGFQTKIRVAIKAEFDLRDPRCLDIIEAAFKKAGLDDLSSFYKVGLSFPF